MNNLNKYLPNEIIDAIAKKMHESIMLDLNEEFKDKVEACTLLRLVPIGHFVTMWHHYYKPAVKHSTPSKYFWFNGELLSTGYFGDTSASEGEDTDSD